ncbi:MAG TPA: serine/threonine-protein kinase, partial [Planctomycetota bacterium]|nr:serine/threonine-protein kinase [Planctomycetota bacterium]
MAVEPGRNAAEAAFFEFLSGGAGTGSQAFERFCAERPALAPELGRLWASWCEMEPMLKSLLADDEGDLSLARLLAGGPAVDTTLPSVSLHLLDGRPQRGEAAVPPSELLDALRERSGFGRRYRLDGTVGRGGMGAVHLAWDHNLRRHLAMKVVHAEPGSGAGQALLARFLEEALVTGQLDHPGIVPVHELGVDEKGDAYFTMKLVKGKSFQRILELVAAGEEGWTLTRAVGVLRRVCEAVAYAHSKGVVHRDIKPANVLVGRYGETYLMDWGLARVLRPGESARAAPEAEAVD